MANHYSMANSTLRKKNIVTEIIKHKYMYLLLLPGIVYFIVFKYLPMGGLVIAFKDYSVFSSMWDAPWAGLKYFKEILHTYDLQKILTNTILISSYKILAGFPAPIILSILLNEIRNRYFKKGVQFVIYLPHFISWIVISGIMLSLFSPVYGLAGDICRMIGVQPVNLLTDSSSFRLILVLSDVWKEAGWGTIIYLAAISTIDSTYYEAAIMDGANRLKQIWYITLPSLSKVIVLLLILRIGNIMSAGFDQIFVLQNDLVRDVSDIFDTFVYRYGLRQGNYSYSTAIGLFNSVISTIFIFGANHVSKLLGKEGIF